MSYGELQHMWENGTLIGERVKLLGEVRTVERIYNDIPGAIRLDHEVGNFVSWNISEVILHRPGNSQ
jgi:hypothetical protein